MTLNNDFGKFLILFLVILLSFTTRSYSQEYVKIKTLDQKLIKGYILKSFDSVGVNISLYGSNMRIPYDDIRKISFPKRNDSQSQQDYLKNYTFSQFENGFYHSLGLSLLFGGDQTGLNASLVNGYKFHPLLNAGLGVSYQNYFDMSTVPVYLETRGYFKEGKFIPFYYGNLGYGFLTKDQSRPEVIDYDAQGGLYWSAGAGVQINYFETALAFSLGYNFQKAYEEYSLMDWWGGNEINITENNMFRRLELKVSLIF